MRSVTVNSVENQMSREVVLLSGFICHFEVKGSSIIFKKG